MLKLRGVQNFFGDVRVLNGVNLNSEKDFVYTLQGGHGLGKTVLNNIISGFLNPDEGRVESKAKKINPFFVYCTFKHKI